MAKTVEELKKFYAEKEKALKEAKNEAIKKAAAKQSKKEALEKTRLRKQDSHVKILIGGYVMAEMKAKKDGSLLDKVAASVKSDRDKELLKLVKAGIGKS